MSHAKAFAISLATTAVAVAVIFRIATVRKFVTGA